jgi:hypothetical protein
MRNYFGGCIKYVMWCGMAFRILVIWRDSIPPHEFISYVDPLPIYEDDDGQIYRVSGK